MDFHESTSTSTSTTTSTSTKQRSLKRKTGDEDNGATSPALEDGFVEDGLATSAANLAMRAIRTRRAKRRRANARRATMGKVTAEEEEEEQEEDGEEDVMGKAVAEEIGGGSLHLCGGSGGRDGKRKKPARQAKNVLNFISYVPPAPAPNRKKNLHSSPRLLAWLRENFEAARGTSLAKDEVYGEYVAFCQADGKDPMLPSMFGKMVHRAFPGLKSSRTGAKGKAKHCYKGFRVRAPSGKPSMVVTSIYDDNEEEELIEDAAEFDDEDSCANSTSASRPSQSTTFSSPSLPYGAVPVSGSSSSSSPNSSPVRAQGRRRPSPAGGGRLNSSSPSSSINGDGYFSSPHVLPPAGAPSPPFDTAVDRTGVAMPPFPRHSRESFLGMLQSPPQAIEAPLGQHHSLRPHLPMGSLGPVAPPHLQQLALLHQHHQQQQQQQAQYPPHHPASGMPLPRSYPSHYSYAPLQYPSPNATNASPLPPAGALHQPSSSTQPSRTPPQQMPLHQGEEGEQPGSPIDCVPSPTSDFYFPPYISPLSVPLPFLPSFSFSLPPSSPQPSRSTSTPPVHGMVTERQDVLQSQHRSSMMDQPGLDSFSNSSSGPSSSSSSPSQDATLCYEREINGPLYASLPEEGFGMHAHLAHHPTQQQQRLLQQQQQPYPAPALCPTDYVLRAHDAHRYAQSMRQGDRNARHQTAQPAGNGAENGSYAPQEQQRPDGQRG